MKIIIIGTVASSIFGFRKELIEILIENGHSVFVFAIDFDELTLSKARSMGVTPVQYRMSRGGLNIFDDVLEMLRLRKKIKLLDADLVFSYFSKPLIYGTLAAKMSRVPRVVGMLEGLGQTFTKHPSGEKLKIGIAREAQLLLYWICFRYLDCLIFLNKDDLHEITVNRGLLVNRSEVLGGIGVNLDAYQFSKIPQSPISFVFVGRLIIEKGIKDFIAAALIVRARHPKAIFTVIGGVDDESSSGFNMSDLRVYIDNGLINYVGQVENVAFWLKQSSVFVLPSFYREGVPRSTQEALAVGRPIITTDLPGCRETVIDGANGFLVPPWRPDLIAEKMCYFIENIDVMNDMGLASRKLAVEKFNALVVSRKLAAILESIP